MGILNVTPDSFSDGGLFCEPEKAVARGRQLEQDGADILDIGGESTRPGNLPVSEEEETRRVVPVIEALAPRLRIPISVDTYRAAVARRAIEAGAQIVNDISGLRYDPALPQLVRASGVGLVLMHSRGARQVIHSQPATGEAVSTVRDGLQACLRTALDAGIAAAAIVLDPGIGFSKDAAASFKVLKSLSLFSRLQYPILIGTSRKSFIRSLVPDPPELRLMGTAATVAASIGRGAHIVRVHDVREMRIVADVTDRILKA